MHRVNIMHSVIRQPREIAAYFPATLAASSRKGGARCRALCAVAAFGISLSRERTRRILRYGQMRDSELPSRLRSGRSKYLEDARWIDRDDRVPSLRYEMRDARIIINYLANTRCLAFSPDVPVSLLLTVSTSQRVSVIARCSVLVHEGPVALYPLNRSSDTYMLCCAGPRFLRCDHNSR